MSVTETYTATLCSRTYNGTANRYPNASGTESPAATHGYYGSNGNWIGMVLLPVSLAGKRIKAITLTMIGNAAGTASSKTVYIYSSNYQTTTATGTGSIYPKDQLGSISGVFRNQTTTVSLSGRLLANVAEYYSSGGQMLVLYDPTASEANYCRFTDITIEITYGNAGTVRYKHNGVWEECEVYYKVNGVYEQVIPHYKKNGVYEECSSG